MARIGINGFGRIGRYLVRLMAERNEFPVVINARADNASLAHLFKYDSVHHTFKGTVGHDENGIIINGTHIAVTRCKPNEWQWKDYAVVVVATVRALKHHGGCPKAELGSENLAALEAGLPNLLQHVANITEVYGLPCVVAVNRFPTDTEAELELVENRCRALGVNVALSEVWAKGGEGGVALAEEVIRLCDAPNHFTFSYELDASIEDKLAAIVTKVYHGDGVVLTPTAQKQAAELTELGFGSLPICMAKTQYSFSDNAALLGAPRGFTITVRNIKVSAGAGFLVALTGDIMTMPGLPKVPAAEKVDVDENGRISGLF